MTTAAFYDIHTHLADLRVVNEFDAIVQQARAHGVAGILVTPARQQEWEAVLAMRHTPGVYIALGVHPGFLDNWNDASLQELRQLCQAGQAISAVGEIGLDFTSGRQHMSQQLQAFEAQLRLAVELNKPVILHNRKSWNEFFDLWRSIAAGRIAGVCHHFTGSRQLARQALDAGLYLSFCGPITYDNARRIKEVARYVPLNRVLSETDTPDLPIAGHWGEQSRPHQVAAVVAELARLQNISLPAMAAHIQANFCRVLNLAC